MTTKLLTCNKHIAIINVDGVNFVYDRREQSSVVTDKEKLCNLLTEFGVEWREKPEGIKCGGYHDYEKIEGFMGFYTLFEFNEDGSFHLMGSWE